VDEWAIKDLARAAGVTSRTLRHYEQIGLLLPSRVGFNGYRFYGEAEVARLYRILSLREFGMPLEEIRAVLDGEADLEFALREHRRLLAEELNQLRQRITTLDKTIQNLEIGAAMDIKTIFATFDPAAHEQEVRQRWGDDAWETNQARRAGRSESEREVDQQRSIDVNQALRQAAEDGLAPTGEQFQQLVAKHYGWITDQWGSSPSKDAYLGLADIYVSDARFADFYGGPENAKAITRAIRTWADTNL